MIRGLGNVAATLATVAIVLFVALSGVLAGNGNNGTLKIHETSDPNVGTPSNDPKVCQFNVEAFNLDLGQNGYLVFTSQGGDQPSNADVVVTPAFGTGADASGYAESAQISLPAGHWKATLYGKFGASGYEDVKAKSKVFKKTCGGSPEDGGPGEIG